MPMTSNHHPVQAAVLLSTTVKSGAADVHLIRQGSLVNIFPTLHLVCKWGLKKQVCPNDDSC